MGLKPVTWAILTDLLVLPARSPVGGYWWVLVGICGYWLVLVGLGRCEAGIGGYWLLFVGIGGYW